MAAALLVAAAVIKVLALIHKHRCSLTSDSPTAATATYSKADSRRTAMGSGREPWLGMEIVLVLSLLDHFGGVCNGLLILTPEKDVKGMTYWNWCCRK